jgi:hypothetical protein
MSAQFENSLRIKDADYARRAVAATASGTRQLEARIGMAKLVASHGNYTPEGKAVWAEYLEAGCPAS